MLDFSDPNLVHEGDSEGRNIKNFYGFTTSISKGNIL